jgi:hypothetical protein
MKLLVYAIVVTVVLLAALTNPPADQHYEKLAQLYPWVNESVLADARQTVWRLALLSDRKSEFPYNSTIGFGQDLRLIYTSLGVLSFVRCDERWPLCANDQGASKPISIGFLGYVFAERPPKGLYEEENAAKQGQAKPFAATLGGQRILNLKPADG